MHFEISVDIKAPPETVWNLLKDVERWPEMTPSITRVELLDKPFTLSSRARVHQPKLPPALWTVTAFEENKTFTWKSHAPGVTTTATHDIIPNPNGTASVRLTLSQKGPLAPILSLLTARLTRRYVTLEATGLKSKAENP
ncbi:polyketide cyclase/dehydrase/lipid transport protein [Actinomadura pelletieri DSM 43383]|uniref:Polyketide cyclase/dehydrase/lipid transport protein n=1 Tax=Actinomadura pelletieri DSM 43383 TaxID=1120940 RepID=A0A495QPG6_9ACTN|nr:SRPBCC family protein [Actinomadura pelletieri]RKS74858.1 polyketide cyclase/dehydrase/lipid transport protein [Actinomadura pelletieri DSM 43383]